MEKAAAAISITIAKVTSTNIAPLRELLSRRIFRIRLVLFMGRSFY